MQFTKQSLKYDEIARNLCKPLGCRVVRCMSRPSPLGCGREMDVLNQCIATKRQEILKAVKQGRSLSSIQPVRQACEPE